MPVPFISQQDLSDRLGRDVTNDPGALSAVDAACDICRIIGEQDFNADTTTISIDGTGSDAIVLPQRPVTNVSAVTVNGDDEPDFTFTPTGLLFRGTAGGSGASWWRPVWPRGRQNVVVTYDHGFADQELPRDVREVALQIAMRLVVQGAAIAETVGAVQVRYAVSAGDLDKNELRILQKYRGPAS